MIGKTPDRIWLIDEGSEIIWHDDPDPSGYVDESDTEEYIKASSLSESARTAGCVPIDPEFMRLVELSLDEMIDYANSRALACDDPILVKIIHKDIEAAEKVMTDIAKWFDSIST